MGRPRKSRHKLEVAGTFRPDRHGARATPAPAALPVPPERLTDGHRAIWDQIVSDATSAGVTLHPTDAILLEILVNDVLEYRQLCALAEEIDVTASTSQGPTVHPVHRLKEAAGKRVLALAERFGLTPKARAVMGVVPPQPPGKRTKLQELLDGPEAWSP